MNIIISADQSDTLREVVESDVPVSSFGTTFKSDVQQSSEPLMRRLLHNLETHFNFDKAYRDLAEGKAILLESQQNSQYKMRELFTDEYELISLFCQSFLP